MGKLKLGQKIKEVFLMIPFFIALCGMGVLVSQGIGWLKHGQWKQIRAGWLLDQVLPPSALDWLHGGHSWSGANNVISYIFNSSLALFLLVFGFILLILMVKTFDMISRPAKNTEKKGWRG